MQPPPLTLSFLCRPTAFFFRLAGAVGRQRALHTENIGFAATTLRRHISTFRGYRILFSYQWQEQVTFYEMMMLALMVFNTTFNNISVISCCNRV
jgi:hypothetical protein